jgi:NAD(P)-dependent dehydrogenase (short-subunit alcohol dehydrogenase family)
VVGVNLDGAFLVAKHAFKMMRDQQPQGGRIINNGSISAHVPRPGSAAYTASKHAITGLTKSISLDGRPFSIACSQIDIGNAASAMTDAMKKGVPQADGSMKPEPVMDVSNVSSAVVYMASLPLDANVQFMTVMATNMPFIGRG